jgi:hypothetical protein
MDLQRTDSRTYGRETGGRAGEGKQWIANDMYKDVGQDNKDIGLFGQKDDIFP